MSRTNICPVQEEKKSKKEPEEEVGRKKKVKSYVYIDEIFKYKAIGGEGR